MSSALPSFGDLLRTAWRLVQPRLRGLIILSLIPALPVFFLSFPRVVQSRVPLELALLLFIVAFVLTVVTRAGMFAYLGDPQIHGGRMALRRGWEIFAPYIWTEILVAVVVVVALLPGLLVGGWMLTASGQGALSSGTAALTAVVAVALLLPGIGAAVWYAFAPLAVAVGSKGGPAALALSSKLVRGHFWPVVARLLLWVIIQAAIARVVSPLPVLNWLVPYLVSLLGLAYFMALYQALRKV